MHDARSRLCGVISKHDAQPWLCSVISKHGADRGSLASQDERSVARLIWVCGKKLLLWDKRRQKEKMNDDSGFLVVTTQHRTVCHGGREEIT
ncbi:cyclic beta 1-2 glucan synthetase [Sesbania bispinosa]|nr:cyclic beta 1-2 glucan synthetase [Sesbania bispinosa]